MKGERGRGRGRGEERKKTQEVNNEKSDAVVVEGGRQEQDSCNKRRVIESQGGRGCRGTEGMYAEIQARRRKEEGGNDKEEKVTK